MKVLAFETATPRGSVALVIDGRVIGERHIDGAAAHSRACLGFAEELVAEAGISLADVDVFAASRGPGSFIGVRVGLTLAKGLAWSLGKPVVGISTLEALAFGALNDVPEGGRILALLDARVDEIYGGEFLVRAGRVEPLGPEFCCPPSAVGDLLVAPDSPRLLVGTGAARYGAEGALARLGTCAPEAHHHASATHVAVLAEREALAGRAIAPADLTAVYLRDAVVAKKE